MLTVGVHMYAVTVRQPDGSSVSAEIRNGHCLVGRESKRSDLLLNDEAVSRAHVIVRDNDGELTVEDLSSSNGTYLDGKRLEPGQQYPLRIDQPVYIGASLLTVA